MAAIQADNSLGNLASLIGGISDLFGKTSTTTTSVSGDAQKALLNNILQGTQGLAAVAGGQHTAGLYNSTTNQQLINDLLARSTAQVAAENKTTSTNTQSNLTQGGGLSKIALALGSRMLMSKGSDLVKSLLNGNNSQSALANALSGGTVGSPSADSVAALNAANGGDFSAISNNVAANSLASNAVLNGVTGNAGTPLVGSNALFTTLGSDATGAVGGLTTLAGQNLFNLGGGTLSSAVDAGTNGVSTLLGPGYSSLLDLGGSSTAAGFAGSAAGDVASGLGDTAGALGDTAGIIGDASSVAPYLGSAIKLFQGDVSGAAGSALGTAIGTAIMPGIGTVLGGLLGGSGIGSDIVSGIGDVFGGIAGGIGDLIGDIGDFFGGLF